MPRFNTDVTCGEFVEACKHNVDHIAELMSQIAAQLEPKMVARCVNGLDHETIGQIDTWGNQFIHESTFNCEKGTCYDNHN